MDVKACRYAALTMMLLSAGALHAQAPTVGELDKIQADTLRLRAIAVQARAQKDVADLRGESQHVGASDVGGGLPVARGVFGANGTRYVSFLYPSGGTAEAAAGGKIPGDYTVKSFDATGVVLLRGKQIHRIPFAMQAPTPAAPASVTPNMGAPFGVPMSGPVTTVPPMR